MSNLDFDGAMVVIKNFAMEQVAHLIIEDLWCYIDEFIDDKYFKEQIITLYPDVLGNDTTIYVAKNGESFATFLHNDAREVYHFHADDCLSIIMNYDKHLNECKKNVRKIIEKEYKNSEQDTRM